MRAKTFTAAGRALASHLPSTGLRPTGTRSGRRGRAPVAAAAAVALAGALLAAVQPSASASIGPGEATLISTFPADIATVYETSTQRYPSATAGGPGSAAATSAVRAACTSGAPLYDAQWYALPASGLARVATISYRGYRESPTEQDLLVAYVAADTYEVLSCSASRLPLPPDRPVLLATYFAASVPTCTEDTGWFSCDAPVSLATLHQIAATPPANDDWTDATPISGDSFHGTVDTSGSSFDGLGPIQDGCFFSQLDPTYLGNVWFRYTPSFTGHVNVSALSAKPGLWSWPIIAELGPSGPIVPGYSDNDECVGTNQVEAGKTYLIAVGGFFDPYYGEPDTIGGEVYLTVDQAETQRPVRELRASVDSAAKTATMSWYAPYEGTPVSSYRVARTGPDGGWATTVPASTSSFTFTGLKGWEPYTLSVEPIGTSGVRSPDAPVSTVFAYLSQPQPSAPLAVESHATGVRRIDVTWREPAFTGDHPISGYRVRRFTATGTTAERTWTVPATARSYSATGLAIGRGYRFDVTAINSDGNGRPSAKTASITLTGIPSAPTSTAASGNAAARTATLTWQPPADNGGVVILGYVVGRDGVDSTGAGPWSGAVGPGARSKVFTRLVPGVTYTLYVRAVTLYGMGPKATVTVTL